VQKLLDPFVKELATSVLGLDLQQVEEDAKSQSLGKFRADG
jgi:hypothetical protein